MPIRLLDATLVTALAATAVTGAEDSPKYEASIVCVNPATFPPRLVVHVIDTSGEPIPGAEIRVEASGTQVATGLTNGDGRLNLAAVPPGALRVEAAMEGFATARVKLRTALGCTTAVTVPIEVGGLGGPAAP